MAIITIRLTSRRLCLCFCIGKLEIVAISYRLLAGDILSQGSAEIKSFPASAQRR
jgi:hypothetical protein